MRQLLCKPFGRSLLCLSSVTNSSRCLQPTWLRFPLRRFANWPQAVDHQQISPKRQNPSPSSYYHREETAVGNAASDTIYALSTASGRAAIAVIRISGPACTQVSRHVSGPQNIT